MSPRHRIAPTIAYATAALCAAVLRALWAADDLLGVWRHRYVSRRELAELPLHILRDIGVTPGEARREADKPFWRA